MRILLGSTFRRLFPPLWHGNIGLITSPYTIGKGTSGGVETFVKEGGRTGIAVEVDVNFTRARRTPVVIFVAWAEDGLGDTCGY